MRDGVRVVARMASSGVIGGEPLKRQASAMAIGMDGQGALPGFMFVAMQSCAP